MVQVRHIDGYLKIQPNQSLLPYKNAGKNYLLLSSSTIIFTVYRTATKRARLHLLYGVLTL